MADERELLVEFAMTGLPDYYRPYVEREVDEWLAARQQPDEPCSLCRDDPERRPRCQCSTPPAPPLTLGCEHGRAVGHPCPHCMGINAPPAPAHICQSCGDALGSAGCDCTPPAPCPECRDRPGRVAINGQEVPCNTCGRVWTPDAKERP